MRILKPSPVHFLKKCMSDMIWSAVRKHCIDITMRTDCGSAFFVVSPVLNLVRRKNLLATEASA